MKQGRPHSLLSPEEKRARRQAYRKIWLARKTPEERAKYNRKIYESKKTYQEAEIKRIDKAIELLVKHGYTVKL